MASFSNSSRCMGLASNFSTSEHSLLGHATRSLTPLGSIRTREVRALEWPGDSGGLIETHGGEVEHVLPEHKSLIRKVRH